MSSVEALERERTALLDYVFDTLKEHLTEETPIEDRYRTFVKGDYMYGMNVRVIGRRAGREHAEIDLSVLPRRRARHYIEGKAKIDELEGTTSVTLARRDANGKLVMMTPAQRAHMVRIGYQETPGGKSFTRQI